MSRLKDRIAVVTGAASGIGVEIAIRLASEGATLEILDRNDGSVVCDHIRTAGGTANSMICDVTNEEQIDTFAQAIDRRHGRLDILVNNAGVLSGRTPWHTLARDEVNRFIQVNFIGSFLVSRRMYPLLKRSRAGRIINVASRTFYLGNPGMMAYVASKGALIGMTRVLARELGDEGITVNAVAPGMVATPGTLAYSQHDVVDEARMKQAIKKSSKPQDLSALIAFLASDDAEMITGQFILADGGGYLH